MPGRGRLGRGGGAKEERGRKGNGKEGRGEGVMRKGRAGREEKRVKRIREICHKVKKESA